MSGQFDIFGHEFRDDLALGEMLRDSSLAQVEQSSAWWIPYAVAAVREIVAVREEFTTDAVWAVLDRRKVPPPHEPRAIGAAMQRAAADGLCEATEKTRRSVRPECHARPIRVWRALV